ncbi:hypothetical protein NLI96_g12128 [Meripilus lineatus]|uniref:non-specific serine/threonine protein kinase n=1 Tax=Meripilus lineatus TaxID=2056292 RepID=A0AAD5UQN7_9APHY|nr:hypothetical protein NLI96_g12128 [Physisporinus lineatus]
MTSRLFMSWLTNGKSSKSQGEAARLIELMKHDEFKFDELKKINVAREFNRLDQAAADRSKLKASEGGDEWQETSVEIEVTGVGTIDLASIVRSCLVNLLAEIITTMGDNPEGPTDTTIRAIIRVEAAANKNPRDSAERDVGAILRPKMLGVITSLHDLLQDLHGKKSIETKRLMATMQSMLPVPEFAETTLQSWQTFLQVLDPKDLGPLLATTSASFVTHWPTFSHHAREIAKKSIEYLIIEKGESLKLHLGEVADLGSIPHLAEVNARLHEQRPHTNPAENVEELLERASNDNVTVAARALGELKEFMLSNASNMNGMTSGDVFDPLVGRLLSVLMAAACRVGENVESLNMLAYDCIGILGAIDPDRIDLGAPEPRLIMLSNFTDEEESVSFALHIVTNVLVGTFKPTSDIMYQRHVAYTIQELLRFSKFKGSLINPNGGSVPLKVRTRWANLPKHVQEAISPLLELRYHSQICFNDEAVSPIYPNQATYREWIQHWTASLISRVNTRSAQDIFRSFMVLVRNKDAGVAHYLLPHLALTVLVSGTNDDAANIRNEILSVLEDQVDPDSPSTYDKKELSSQVIFMLMDPLNEWVRLTRQHLNTAVRAETRRGRSTRGGEAEEQLVKVDSILSSIDQSLMAKAALKCKAYARALMCYEQQIVALRSHNNTTEVQDHYERLHEIYSQLDEPDGMEGVSTLILSPSLDHQIRQHESTGRWTSAQSCWEVRLQNSPDELASHLGLLECLRNLGHYGASDDWSLELCSLVTSDTMRTQAKGVLTRNPGWQAELVRYQVESEWNIGNWDEVQTLVKLSNKPSASVLIAQILLAMRSEDQGSFSTAIVEARRALGGPITAAGTRGYRRCYESVVNLHLVHELEMIYHLTRNRSTGKELDSLLRRLSSRLDSTLPAYRIREPILGLCRTAFGHWPANIQSHKDVISRSWLNSAKLARKAGYWQTAYCATLQAQQRKQPFVLIESSKLTKAIGESLNALQELETSMQVSDIEDQDVIDLTGDEDNSKRMKAKAKAHRARWMNDSDRFDVSQVLKAFQEATELWPDWESGQFHLGRFHDDCFKTLSPADQLNRGTKMNLQTVKSFSKAIRYGSKYIYQTVPRLLTLWLDMGEHPTTSKSETFTRINLEVSRAIKNTPVCKWYTAFPQIVSRVGHTNKEVFAVLSKLISGVIHEFPKQALWLFASVVKSTKHTRRDRGKHILDKLQSHPSSRTEVAALITACRSMIDELLNLCNYPVRDDKTTMLMMSKDFPRLFRQVPSTLIIPLQESLTPSLPPTSASEVTHQPFRVDTPTFAKFHEEIDIMKSLANPRKITITGSDNKVYMFLGKPKDDLRKDARLMDFNAIINKLLKSNSESRRRHLYIRTYGVVTLNEECGFIQWVPNTIPLRPVLLKYYSARGVRQWDGAMGQTFQRIKEMPDQEAATLSRKISSLVIFHERFLETFPEPSAWLASRLSFSRTAAVMSMVGFILGLGDRHTENILLDVLSGDAVHVDFNCLFEKGKTLETPERVPFRLTQNMVDGLGITGVEGVFRNGCEITMQLLRDNKDTLMSVLDAFVHDPLVEWEDEKRKLMGDDPAAKVGSTSLFVAQALRSPVDLLCTQNFIPKLKDHLLTRLRGEVYDGDEVEYSDEERAQVRIIGSKIYCHKVLRLQYTTYDARRGQDSINPRTTHCNVLLNSRETGPSSHPFWYAQDLGIFHARVLHVGPNVTNRSAQHMEFLWVRWSGMSPDSRYGPKYARLPQVGFVKPSDPNAFGFLDPSLAIRAVHLIPSFADGRTNELLPHQSVARPPGQTDDWARFYVNIFADRDMFMRYFGGGVGHPEQPPYRYQTSTLVREDDPEPLPTDNEAGVDGASETSSDEGPSDEEEWDDVDEDGEYGFDAVQDSEDLGPEDGEDSDGDSDGSMCMPQVA